MEHIYGHDKCPSESVGDCSQLTNWISKSGAKCHMTPQVSDYIPGSLEDMDKHIKVSDRHHITAKQKRQVRIKFGDNNRDPFIATQHNVLLLPDLCDKLFSIITLMNSGHNCLFQQVFGIVYFGAKQKNAVTLPHSAQR